jgi:molybdenum cofactor biosynthesis protein B
MSTENPRHEQAPPPSIFAVLTISDDLTRETDEAGSWLKDELRRRGHMVANYSVIGENVTSIRTAIQTLVHGAPLDVVITNGGTGISDRDHTVEAIGPLLKTPMEGFGELFRMLSFQKIGASAMFSRAFAGRIERSMIFCLPGSQQAVKIGFEELILPELGHLQKTLKKK